MKIKLLSTFVLALTLFSGCGGSSTSVSSKEDANKIIGYTNNVIDYLNEAGEWFSGSEDDIAMAIESPRAEAKPRSSIFVRPFIFVETSSKNISEATTSLSKDEQAFFNTNIALFKTKFEGMREDMTKLKEYYQSEDFKDDKYVKGKALADSIETKYNALMQLRTELFAKIDQVTLVAEKIILEDHPLRDPILALKGDLAAFDSLYSVCENLKEGKTTLDKVETVYTSLEQSVTKNKDLYADILNENNEKSAYDSFYKEAESSLGVYRKALRNVKDGKQLTDSDLSDFSYERGQLIDDFNNFGD